MDTTKLVVGQDVYMVNSRFCRKGKVVKVTPSYVDVQMGVMQVDGTWNAHELFRFGRTGERYERYESEGTPEDQGTWELVDGNPDESACQRKMG